MNDDLEDPPPTVTTSEWAVMCIPELGLTCLVFYGEDGYRRRFTFDYEQTVALAGQVKRAVEMIDEFTEDETEGETEGHTIN